MALNITSLVRVFNHGKNVLPDPNPKLSPDEVMSFYANTYPELTTSSVHGPTIAGDKAKYDFRTTVGTKG